MNNDNLVQEVFGKFAVEVDGNVKLFDTLPEAQEAAVLNQSGLFFQDLAEQYTSSGDNTPKQAKQKQNIIVDFLAWQVNNGEAPEIEYPNNYPDDYFMEDSNPEVAEETESNTALLNTVDDTVNKFVAP